MSHIDWLIFLLFSMMLNLCAIALIIYKLGLGGYVSGYVPRNSYVHSSSEYSKGFTDGYWFGNSHKDSYVDSKDSYVDYSSAYKDAANDIPSRHGPIYNPYENQLYDR